MVRTADSVLIEEVHFIERFHNTVYQYVLPPQSHCTGMHGLFQLECTSSTSLQYAIVLYGKLVTSVISYVLLHHHNNWLIGLINLVA